MKTTRNSPRDISPFWQAILCAVLAFLVMRCWSEEGEQKPLDLFVVKRTDTDRYAELRALVEAWQTARSASERNRASIPPAVSTLTANPTGQPEGWLSRYMDTCAAETLLADWSHR